MDRDAVTACDPGGGAIGTIGDMTAFYGALLDIVRGRREGPWSRQIVERFVGRRRTDTPDATFRHTMDWGLGVMVNSSRHGEATVPYGFGPLASDEAFGHGGYQSSVAFADPSSDLVVAVVCNGHPGEAKHDRRMRRALKAMAEDLRAADGAGLPGQTATSE
jgi:CubicO group peptidase (beta-lactamase class C family)